MEKSLREIEEQVAQGTTRNIEGGLIIIQDWCFTIGETPHIVKLIDIAVIIGILGAGTYMITDDGEVIETFFGEEQWGEVFSLFKNANPYLMSGDDKVDMPNDDVVDIRNAFKKKTIGAIAGEFLHRKQNG